MTKKLQRVGDVYKKSSALAKLSLRTQRLKQLNTILQQLLPPQFVDHCHLANINEHTVVVHTDNASYASLLRFQSQTICSGLSKQLPQIVNKLEVKVRAQSLNTKIKTSLEMTLSSNAANALQQTADSMDDSSLKSALEKLAKRNQ